MLTAVSIPLEANAKLALQEPHTRNSFEMKYPEALFLIAGNFNQANHKNVLPECYQHIFCPIRGPNALTHNHQKCILHLSQIVVWLI